MTTETKAEQLAKLEALTAPLIKDEIKRIQKGVIEEPLIDDFVPPPEPSPEMFYGIVGKVGAIAAQGTEVNPVAAMTAFLSFLGANVGRDSFLAVANTCHHPRLFTLHIGRSGRGRKGDSMQLTMRILRRIAELDKNLLGQLHTGGLSSREGLASIIQDAQGDKAGTTDKRLLVIESEFSNVLHQTRRDGNTLSSSLRDAWDGSDIKPAVKNGRVWVSEPHIGIHGNITPGELISLMTSREMNNGFANRFLFIWAETDKEKAFPERTPEPVIEELAHEVMAILSFAKAKYPDTQNSHEISLSEAARGFYERVYPSVRRPLNSEFITNLLERRAPYLLRLSMLFALTDKSRVIEPRHLKAAKAWVDYAVHSVSYIFQDQVKSSQDDETRRNAEKILLFLRNRQKGCTMSDLNNECFKGNLLSQKINKALNYLLSDIPKKIERQEVKKTGRGRNPVLYVLKTGTEKTEEFAGHERRGSKAFL